MQKICRKNTNRELSITHSLSIHENRKNCKKTTQKIRKTKVLRQIQTLSIKGMSSTSANRRHIYLSKQVFYHQKRKSPFLKGISLAKRELWRQRKKERNNSKKITNWQRKIQCEKAFLQCIFARARNSPASSYLAEQNFHLPGEASCKNAWIESKSFFPRTKKDTVLSWHFVFLHDFFQFGTELALYKGKPVKKPWNWKEILWNTNSLAKPTSNKSMKQH